MAGILTLWEDRTRVEGDALLSADGVYRYWLKRTWALGPRVCWVMLNPSTADANLDDPTIRRCIGFSKSWGYGSLIVVNLWALRATDPRELLTADDPYGPDNAEAVELAINGSELMVAAWGTFVARMTRRSARRIEPEAMARDALVDARCLGRTKSGHPRHPLYVRADQPLEVW